MIFLPFLFVYLGLINENKLWFSLNNFHFENLTKVFSNHDTGWYFNVAKSWYFDTSSLPINEWNSPHQHYAFFPLFPFLIRLFAEVFKLEYNSASFIISLLSNLFLIYYLIKLMLSLDYNKDQIFKIGLTILLFPFLQHLYFNYTESIFLMLVLASFYYIKSNNNLAFLFTSFLLVLTRPNGIVMIMPLYIFYLEENKILSIKHFFSQLIKTGLKWFSFMFLGLFIWCFFQYVTTGSFFKFAEVQVYWQKKSMFPLFAMFRQGYWQYQILSIISILYLLILFYFRKKERLSFQTFNLITWVMPLSAGSVISIGRYMGICFPLYFKLLNFNFISNKFKYFIIINIFFSILYFYFWLKADPITF